MLLLVILHSDRLATDLGDLESEAAVIVLVPDRCICFGADLADEALGNQSRGHLHRRCGIQICGPRCESLMVLRRRREDDQLRVGELSHALLLVLETASAVTSTTPQWPSACGV